MGTKLVRPRLCFLVRVLRNPFLGFLDTLIALFLSLPPIDIPKANRV